MTAPHLSLGVSAAAFRILYVAFIVTASLQTLASALAPSAGPHEHSLLSALALTEIAAALLFAFRATEYAGCVLLLIVFAIVQILAITQGELTLRFVFYAGTALFVLGVARTARAREANLPAA